MQHHVVFVAFRYNRNYTTVPQNERYIFSYDHILYLHHIFLQIFFEMRLKAAFLSLQSTAIFFHTLFNAQLYENHFPRLVRMKTVLSTLYVTIFITLLTTNIDIV